jgi:diacylglycerol kinase family enzyme
MEAIVIYNRRSGSALPPSELDVYFSQSNITVNQYVDIADNIQAAIKTHLQKPGAIVIGYGGDGTLSTVAQYLIGTRGVFAPLPGGTLNHFTKDLGINQDLAAAIDHLPKAKTKLLDTACVNDKLFLNNSSIGLYPSSLSERSKIESRLGKWPAAVFASIRALVKFRLYSVDINGESYVTPFIFVGNNNYDSSKLMARNSLEKGVLSIHLVNSTKRRALFKIGILALLGRPKQADEFRTFLTDDATIHINRKQVRISFDGEHARLHTPIHYKINKQSLKTLF